MRKNSNDSKENIRTFTLLKDRTSVYEEYSQKLEGKPTYAEVKAKLDERQAAHDKALSQHKTDLAEFTATKGVIKSGKEALQKAYAALLQANEQLAQVETMLGQVDTAVVQAEAQAEEKAKEYIEAAAVEAASQQLAQARQYGETVLYQQVFDSTWKGIFAQTYGEPYDASKDTAENPEYQSAVEAAKTQAGKTVTPEGCGEQAYQSAKQQVVNYALSTDEAKNAIAEAKATARQTVYDMVLSKLPDQFKGMTYDELKAYVADARKKIDDGFTQISVGNWELEKAEAELPEKEKKLEEERIPLEKEAQELKAEWAEADQLKEDEQKLSNSKALILRNENIKASVDNGTELLVAAKAEIDRREISDKRDHDFRLYANILAVAGGIIAFLFVPAAFEKTKSRFWLIAPVAVFLLFTAAANYFSVSLGRGLMYSCLMASIFSLIQLIIVIPKKEL